MNIQIVSTGSSGNAILFDGSVLIDAGVPFCDLDGWIDDLACVLLTHAHGDHFSSTTIRKIHIANEAVKFCGGDFLKEKLRAVGLPETAIITLGAGNLYQSGDLIFSPVILDHDVPNYGYRLKKGEYRHLHATDTSNMDGITAKNYDSATLEANHCADTAARIIADKRRTGEFCHLERAIKTHLSVQKAVDFVQKNKVGNFMPIHIGASTKPQVLDYLEKMHDHR